MLCTILTQDVRDRTHISEEHRQKSMVEDISIHYQWRIEHLRCENEITLHITGEALPWVAFLRQRRD